MVEKIFAGLTLAVCELMLVRLLVGARRRSRIDTAARRALHEAQRVALSVYHWRDRKRSAARAAEEAIRRARAGATERDGNVYKPKSFRKPPDTLH